MIGSFRNGTCPTRIDAASVPLGNFFSSRLFDYTRDQTWANNRLTTTQRFYKKDKYQLSLTDPRDRIVL